MGRFLQFVLVLVLILAVFPLYTRYKVAAAPVPPGVHLGGLDLSTLKDVDEMRAHLEQIYLQPVDVRFGDARLVLLPEDVDFQVDVAQMVAEAGRYLEGTDFLDIAVREALGFDQQRRDVPVRFMLNHAKLTAWLEEAATVHNHGPAPARLLPPSNRWADGGSVNSGAESGLPSGFVGVAGRDWTWIAGTPGQTLDLEASIPLVVAALTSDRDRVARLALDETPPPPPSMADLAREIDAYLRNFPGFGAAYVHDLRSGEEALVDADVAFSGMSTLKIGIAAAIMQRLPNGIAAEDAEADLVGQWVDYALGESNNYAANQLVAYLGDGSAEVGVRRFTEFMRGLGMTSTYMQSGYDAQVQLAPLPTPGNRRTDWQTNPDSNLQSTAADMGRTLAAIYECSQGRGLLLTTRATDFTADECWTILFYMTHNEFQEMIWGGLPDVPNAWIIHKHGFAYESHSDVALVWGPSGPYVISVFLHSKGWLNWGLSNPTFKTISRITWNFFAFQQEQLGLDGPPAPVLEPPPGYKKLHDYIPTASRGFR
jgi:hypothetical protein